MKPLLQTLALAGFIAMPIAAQAEAITVKLYALGLSAATISLNGAENGNNYAINGRVTASALLKMIKDIGFTGSASGRIENGVYQSRKYAGHAKTGSSNSIVKMHWNGRVPVLDSYTPARERRSYDITPSKQTGTVDILTAAYATFKSRSPETLCNFTQHMFDGRRRTLIRLDPPKISGRIATCTGTYKRVAGFSANKMRKRVNFPFTMHYELQNDGMYRFKDFTADATFGKIRATRK